MAVPTSGFFFHNSSSVVGFIATFTLVPAVARWNIYFDALLYINDNAKRTLHIGKSMVIDNNSQSAGVLRVGDTQMPSKWFRRNGHSCLRPYW